MLIPGQIPKKEPRIRVGIVLPEDDQQNILISASKDINIQIDDNQILEIKNFSSEIHCTENHLRVVLEEKKIQSSRLRITSKDLNCEFIVRPVMAGRGFHWSKKIEVKLSHQIDILIHEGRLLLINELPFEEYLACVSTSEMGPACPEEFIMAQTIVARSWMLANVEQKHVHLGFDVCNDDCCQRFQGRNNLTQQAYSTALKSSGLVLLYQEKICDARYSKSCGGIMESFENLWENKPLPYMQNKMDGPGTKLPNLKNEAEMVSWLTSVPRTYCSPHFIKEEDLNKYLGDVDEAAKYFRWNIRISQKDLLSNINNTLGFDAKAIIGLDVKSRAGSGRILKLEVNYIDRFGNKNKEVVDKDYNARKIMHPDFLFSSACIIKMSGNQSKPDFEYIGGGWGHGAGLCQIGALGMALDNRKVNEILEHYYPGSIIERIYD